MEETTYLIQKAQDILSQASYAVALTGAGVSTPSGIPDFRSPTSGLWDDYDPMEVATIQGFQQHPEYFYNWMRPLAKLILQAQPNDAHRALAKLEHFGPLRAIITQNIDMLHTKAGTRHLYEVHGQMREAECPSCGKTYNVEGRLKKFVETGHIPVCFTCGNILKPNVILFGEALPWRAITQAQIAAQRCDVLIVAGSSLEVAPANTLPVLAHETHARLIIINYTPTHLDHLADVIIRDNVATVLPELAKPFEMRATHTNSARNKTHGG
ncbi:MAG: NAD-dependent deacylase [Anaerolineales bacterium]|nr:NAD-dependent deacylase [Anaerolineales bacterium]